MHWVTYISTCWTLLSASTVALLNDCKIAVLALHFFLSCASASVLLFQRPTLMSLFFFPEMYSKNQTMSVSPSGLWGLVLICSWHSQGHPCHPGTLKKARGCWLDPLPHPWGSVQGLSSEGKPFRNGPCGSIRGRSYLRPCVIQHYISGPWSPQLNPDLSFVSWFVLISPSVTLVEQ